MSVKISACWISLSILLGFLLIVKGEHFYLSKENNIFSNDLQDDWVPISGIDKRSTRNNHGFTQVVHITPPVRYPNQPLNQQSAASNKVEVFAQPPPTILGSFSEFGHSTIEAREPAHTLNFRPSYNFDRHYEDINDRRFQLNDYNESEGQKPPAIVVFNAQQRHPQQNNYQKQPPPPPPPQFYQNFQFHSLNPIGNNQNLNQNQNHNNNNNVNNHNNNNNINNHNNNNINNHKNFGYNELPTVQEPPKRLTPYFVPNDHIFPKPQGNNKQAVYAEQRPKPYLVNPTEPVPQLQQHQLQLQQQQHYKTSTEGGSSGYFQKYPGHVENQKLYPQISNFARPFEQTRDQNVFIKPNQYVHNLNVGTEVRFGQEVGATRPVSVELSTGFTHPATRPFSKYQTPTPKNEELYRIFPVKEVNALPSFLPTPVTLGHLKPADGHQKVPPYFKEPSGGSSEYDAREEQDENESSEQYDILRSPTKPMMTTTTTTVAPPKLTRKRRPMTTASTTTTTTTTAPPEDYDEYAVPNQQQLQLQEQQQDYLPQYQYHHQQQQQQQQQEYDVSTTTEAATNYAAVGEERPIPPVSVNKYKKKKPAPLSRPKEQPLPAAEDVEYVPERVTIAPPSPTTTTTTTTTAVPTTTTTTTAAGLKTKAKYGNGTRPRFSIKDYRTTTTTSTTTTEKAITGRRTTSTTTPAAPTTDPAETAGAMDQQTTTVRKPYKPRARPNRYKQSAATTTTSTTTTTTDEPQQQQETGTEPPRPAAYRSKYKPGKYHNRLRTSTEAATVAAAAVADGEQMAATEPTRPAVYSAKRRTVPTFRTTVDESNALRRSSSATPPNEKTSDTMDAAASSEDVDYVATTVAVIPSQSPSRHKYHTSYAADRPLLPIESFFQSSMAGKRYHNNERR